MNDKETAREQEFMKLLQETLKQARRRGGIISREEVAENFEKLSLDKEQLDQVEAYLKAHKITVGVTSGNEEDLPEEERDFLESYMEMLAAVPRLSDSVLEAVEISAMAGEPSAQKELIEQMLGNVVDIAKLYAGQGVYMEDLIGAGNEALLIAVTQLAPLEAPDEVDGFIGRRIMDAMEDLIALNLDIKAAEKTVEEKVNLVADRAKELAEELGRKVSVAELAKEYEMDPEEIAEAVRLSGNAIADIG